MCVCVSISCFLLVKDYSLPFSAAIFSTFQNWSDFVFVWILHFIFYRRLNWLCDSIESFKSKKKTVFQFQTMNFHRTDKSITIPFKIRFQKSMDAMIQPSIIPYENKCSDGIFDFCTIKFWFFQDFLPFSFVSTSLLYFHSWSNKKKNAVDSKQDTWFIH